MNKILEFLKFNFFICGNSKIVLIYINLNKFIFKMGNTCKEWMGDTSVKCIYLAAVLVLVLLIFMQVRKMGFYYEGFRDRQRDSWQAGDTKFVEFRTGHGYVRNVLPRVGVMGGSAVGLQTTSDTSRIPQAHGYIERY
jgi:hypothetical protein